MSDISAAIRDARARVAAVERARQSDDDRRKREAGEKTAGSGGGRAKRSSQGAESGPATSAGLFDASVGERAGADSGGDNWVPEVGDEVVVERLNGRGRVTAISGGKIEVQVGFMKANLGVHELRKV